MTAIKSDMHIFKKDISKLLDVYNILAPSYVDDKLDYIWITDAQQIAFTDELPYKSPKEAVLPRVEKLITFSETGAADAQDIKPMLLIGVKPCDLSSLKILDEIFIGKKGMFVDNFYLNRRNNLKVIGMNCISEKRGCFCERRGIDPGFSDDCDAFMVADGDDIILNIYSDDLKPLFSGPDVPPIKKTRTPEVSIKIEADEAEIFNTMPWESYVESCLGCGTCTFVCPTCHCFEFKDTDYNGVVSRYRRWDSCMYPKFTLHASGHNPRSSNKERFRQRVMHKYVYIRDNFDTTACTGCGRCIRLCPGGVSIRAVVDDIVNRLEESSNE